MDKCALFQSNHPNVMSSDLAAWFSHSVLRHVSIACHVKQMNEWRIIQLVTFNQSIVMLLFLPCSEWDVFCRCVAWCSVQLPSKPVRTLQEREVAYAEARLRILGSAVSSDEDVVNNSCDDRSAFFVSYWECNMCSS